MPSEPVRPATDEEVAHWKEFLLDFTTPSTRCKSIGLSVLARLDAAEVRANAYPRLVAALEKIANCKSTLNCAVWDARAALAEADHAE